MQSPYGGGGYQSPYGTQTSGRNMGNIFGGTPQPSPEEQRQRTQQSMLEESLRRAEQDRLQQAEQFSMQQQQFQDQLARTQRRPGSGEELIQLDTPGGGGMTRGNWEQMVMQRDYDQRQLQNQQALDALRRQASQGSTQSQTTTRSNNIDMAAIQQLMALMPGRI